MLRPSTIAQFRIRPGSTVNLQKRDPAWSALSLGPSSSRKGATTRKDIKAQAKEALEQSLSDLQEQQDILWASDQYSLLIVLQAMDAAGKDGMIKHVMSGVNPQGCEVRSFKQPSSLELDHTYLWRAMIAAPERGKICIFNRSHYEDVLVVRVHPELLTRSGLPDDCITDRIWKERYEDINAFEQHLVRNGTKILKFFLHISKEEQRQRFLDRLNDPSKHWKFSAADVRERKYWDQYQRAYEDVLSHTSTRHAPWYVIPADNKWVSRALIAEIIASTISDLKLKYPRVDKSKRLELAAARRSLEREVR